MTTTQRTMRCHYEVLGVAMDADAEIIRKAYRKGALEWHPDKNMHRIEEATERFRLISDAYQVLSDPNERAWYDSHRESILRGGDGTFAKGMESDFVPDLWKYFTPGRENFYERYATAFDEIIEAEKRDSLRQQQNQSINLPLFGSKESTFSEVKRFYLHWESFASKMSFAWMDKYDTREAENRTERRYIEKLNETERGNARREYNDLVRSLVGYCKKRDERYILGMAKLEMEEKEKKLLKEKREKEKRELKAAEKLEQRRRFEEEQANLPEEEEDSTAFRLDSEHATKKGMQESEQHIWNCGVCSKEFKSEKQLLNHEGSKKHKDAVKAFLKKGGVLDPPVSQSSKQQVSEHEAASEEEEDFIEIEADLEETVKQAISELEINEKNTEDMNQESEGDDDIEVVQGKTQEGVEVVSETDDINEESTTSSKPKIGKAKLKRMQREAKAKIAGENQPAICTVCQEEFSSRTKLFQHIQDLDHAAPLKEATSSSKVEKGKKKKSSKQ